MYSVIVWQGAPDGILVQRLQPFFKLAVVSQIQQLMDVVDATKHKIIIVGDKSASQQLSSLFTRLKESDQLIQYIPVVLLSEDDALDAKLEAFELGIDDYVVGHVSDDELIARLNKSIFHKIASEQLRSQLDVANKMAFMAMSDTSDLGINIHFLLDSINCSNVDELGQMLFQSLNNYGLKCSLQIRGRYKTKNMEPSGLAKDLEAHLLSELKDTGRYYDFGKRTVMNYNRVSLLVKNMPIDDEKKYGAIKDNVFSLLQGVDARIEALDNHQTLQDERELMEMLTRRMQTIFVDIDDSYQIIIKEIACVVDEMAEQVEESVMTMALTDKQENLLERIVEKGIIDTNLVFNRGLKMDSELQQLIDRINVIFEFKDKPDFYRYMEKIKKNIFNTE